MDINKYLADKKMLDTEWEQLQELLDYALNCLPSKRLQEDFKDSWIIKSSNAFPIMFDTTDYLRKTLENSAETPQLQNDAYKKLTAAGYWGRLEIADLAIGDIKAFAGYIGIDNMVNLIESLTIVNEKINECAPYMHRFNENNWKIGDLVYTHTRKDDLTYRVIGFEGVSEMDYFADDPFTPMVFDNQPLEMKLQIRLAPVHGHRIVDADELGEVRIEMD